MLVARSCKWNNDSVDEFNSQYSSPCKVCKEECRGYGLDDCIECDVCFKWLHYECTGYSYEYLDSLEENNELFICCDRCWMCLFPYSNSSETVLIQAEMQRHFAQEILRISLFIYCKNIHFAQEFSWKMSKNFSLGID